MITFAVDFTIPVTACCRIQTFIAIFAYETHLVPGLQKQFFSLEILYLKLWDKSVNVTTKGLGMLAALQFWEN